MNTITLAKFTCTFREGFGPIGTFSSLEMKG